MEVTGIVQTAGTSADAVRRALDIGTGIALALLLIGIVDFFRHTRSLGKRQALAALRSALTRHPAETFAQHLLAAPHAPAYVQYAPLHRYVSRMVWAAAGMVVVYAVSIAALALWAPSPVSRRASDVDMLLDGAVRTLVVPLHQFISTHATETAMVIVFVGLVNVLLAVGVRRLLRLAALVVTQPRLALAPAGLPGYGVVFDALRKLPVPLATVRLYRENNDRAVATCVSDLYGRYRFAVLPGKYTVRVSSLGYRFPSAALHGKSEDHAYGDLYTGTPLSFRAPGFVTKNIGIDPVPESRLPRQSVADSMRERVHAVAAFVCFIFFLPLFLLVPTPGGLAALVCLAAVLLLIAVVAERRQPSVLGVVRDAHTGMPVPGAAVYLVEAKEHIPLDVQVTNRKGQYGFIAGRGRFAVVVTKDGYPASGDIPVDCVHGPAICAVAPNIHLGSAH